MKKTVSKLAKYTTPPGSRRNVTVREYISSGTKRWTIDSLRSAINQQTTGQFAGTSQLAASMMSDSAYSAALGKRVEGLIRTDFDVEPENADNPREQLAADLLTKHHYQILPETELSKLLTWYQNLSVGLATLDWTYGESVWLPVLRVLNPQYLRYDQSCQKWLLQTQKGEEEVCPGDGRWVLISRWSPGLPSGHVSRLAEDWVAKKSASRSWDDWNDLHGWPITKCLVPSGEQDVNVVDAFISDVAGARYSKTIKLPQGSGPENSYGVDVIAGGSEEYVSFQARIDYADRKFQIGILGGNLSSEVNSSGGNRAASQTHHGVERELVQSDEKLLSNVIREQIYRPFLEMNVADDIETPWPQWNVAVEEDLITEGQAINSFITFVKDIPPGYVVNNLEEIASTFGVELEEVAEVPAPVPTNVSPVTPI